MENRRVIPVSDESDRGDPVDLKRLIKEVMRELAPIVGATRSDARSDDRLEELQDMWKRVVGNPIDEHTRVVRYRGGVMTVEVDFAPLMAELDGFAKTELLENLVDLGLEGIHRLCFRSCSRSSETGDSN